MPLPRKIHPAFKSFPISENAGPVEAVKPARIANGSGGKPIIIPIIRKSRAVANPGNYPECMAETPTISSDTNAAIAAKITQVINMTIPIS